MFEVFSRQYYLGRLYITPSDRNRVYMQREQHEQVNEALFTSGAGIERLDNPLIMKLRNQHFQVHAGEDVPAGTLAVPEDVIKKADISNPPALEEVLLAR